MAPSTAARPVISLVRVSHGRSALDVVCVRQIDSDLSDMLRSRLGEISVHYDSYVFVEQIKSSHWLQMLAAVDTALNADRNYPAVHKRPGMFHPGDDTKYLAFLLATREYLLAEGRLRPPGIDNSMLLLLKPLCEGLIAKGRFPPERLALFSDLDMSSVGILPALKDALRKDGP